MWGEAWVVIPWGADNMIRLFDDITDAIEYAHGIQRLRMSVRAVHLQENGPSKEVEL